MSVQDSELTLLDGIRCVQTFVLYHPTYSFTWIPLQAVVRTKRCDQGRLVDIHGECKNLLRCDHPSETMHSRSSG
jgi:hypothetical protein